MTELTLRSPHRLSVALQGPVATDEGSLLAAARESEEGKVLVAPGAVIALTKALMVCEKPEDWGGASVRENYHCERRPSSGPRAAAGLG